MQQVLPASVLLFAGKAKKTRQTERTQNSWQQSDIPLSVQHCFVRTGKTCPELSPSQIASQLKPSRQHTQPTQNCFNWVLLPQRFPQGSQTSSAQQLSAPGCGVPSHPAHSGFWKKKTTIWLRECHHVRACNHPKELPDWVPNLAQAGD